MKEFVVGSPYTTETTLDPSDEFLIVACDGVSPTQVCISKPVLINPVVGRVRGSAGSRAHPQRRGPARGIQEITRSRHDELLDR